MFIIGPTEAGKSSLATQLSSNGDATIPNAIIKTANNQAAARADGSMRGRPAGFAGDGALHQIPETHPRQKALVKKNVHFAHWRASSETRGIAGKNGEPPVEVSAIDRLLEILRSRHREVWGD